MNKLLAEFKGVVAEIRKAAEIASIDGDVAAARNLKEHADDIERIGKQFIEPHKDYVYQPKFRRYFV